MVDICKKFLMSDFLVSDTVILVGQAGQFQNKPGWARASQARPLEWPTPAGFKQVGTAGA